MGRESRGFRSPSPTVQGAAFHGRSVENSGVVEAAGIIAEGPQFRGGAFIAGGAVWDAVRAVAGRLAGTRQGVRFRSVGPVGGTVRHAAGETRPYPPCGRSDVGDALFRAFRACFNPVPAFGVGPGRIAARPGGNVRLPGFEVGEVGTGFAGGICVVVSHAQPHAAGREPPRTIHSSRAITRSARRFASWARSENARVSSAFSNCVCMLLASVRCSARFALGSIMFPFHPGPAQCRIAGVLRL